jgi:hypothetical protein
MNAILGLYEFPGAVDNPAIIGMAKACGGEIARTCILPNDFDGRSELSLGKDGGEQ